MPPLITREDLGLDRSRRTDLLAGYREPLGAYATPPQEEEDTWNPFALMGEFLGATGKGFAHSLSRGNVSMLGASMEAMGYQDLGLRLQQWGAEGAEGLPPGLRDEDTDTLREYSQALGGLLGSGLGSTAPTIAGGLVGGGLGLLTKNPALASAGGWAGAMIPGYLLNTGEVFAQFKEEGVDPEQGAPIALGLGVVLALVDVAGVGKVAEEVTAKGAKKQLISAVAKRIMTSGARGARAEGVTEGIQSFMREAVTAYLTGDADVSERLWRTAEEMLAGGMTGGVLSGGGRAVAEARESLRTHKTVGERAAEGADGGPAQTTLDRLAQEGRKIAAAAEADTNVSNPALAEFKIPAVGSDVNLLETDADGIQHTSKHKVAGFVEPDAEAGTPAMVQLESPEAGPLEFSLPLDEGTSIELAATPEEQAEAADTQQFLKDWSEALKDTPQDLQDQIKAARLDEENANSLESLPKERRGRVLKAAKQEVKTWRDEEKARQDAEEAEAKRQAADTQFQDDLLVLREDGKGLPGEKLSGLEDSVAADMGVDREKVPEERSKAYLKLLKKRIGDAVKEQAEADKTKETKTTGVDIKPEDVTPGDQVHEVEDASKTEHKFVYRLMDVAEPIGSHEWSAEGVGQRNKLADASLQMRELTGPDESKKVMGMVQEGVNYAKMRDAKNVAQGAPTMFSDKQVVAGHSRLIALRIAYALNLADNYKKALAKDVPEAASMDMPVLMRELQGEYSAQERMNLAHNSNVSETQVLGTAEAFQDALHIDSDLLTLLREGDLEAAANNQFKTQYIKQVIPVSQRANLTTDEGAFTDHGMQRIKRGLVARAYGQDLPGDKTRAKGSNLINNLFALDQDRRSIRTLLYGMAPKWVRMRQKVAADGRPEHDLTLNLVDAVEILQKHVTEVKPYSEMFQQMQLFDPENLGDEGLDREAEGFDERFAGARGNINRHILAMFYKQDPIKHPGARMASGKLMRRRFEDLIDALENWSPQTLFDENQDPRITLVMGELGRVADGDGTGPLFDGPKEAVFDQEEEPAKEEPPAKKAEPKPKSKDSLKARIEALIRDADAKGNVTSERPYGDWPLTDNPGIQLKKLLERLDGSDTSEIVDAIAKKHGLQERAKPKNLSDPDYWTVTAPVTFASEPRTEGFHPDDYPTAQDAALHVAEFYLSHLKGGESAVITVTRGPDKHTFKISDLMEHSQDIQQAVADWRVGESGHMDDVSFRKRLTPDVAKRIDKVSRELRAHLDVWPPALRTIDSKSWSLALELTGLLVRQAGVRKWGHFRGLVVRMYGKVPLDALRHAYRVHRERGGKDTAGMSSDVEIRRLEDEQQPTPPESTPARDRLGKELRKHKRNRVPRKIVNAVRDVAVEWMVQGGRTYGAFRDFMLDTFPGTVMRYLARGYRLARDRIRRFHTNMSARHKAVTEAAEEILQRIPDPGGLARGVLKRRAKQAFSVLERHQLFDAWTKDFARLIDHYMPDVTEGVDLAGLFDSYDDLMGTYYYMREHSSDAAIEVVDEIAEMKGRLADIVSRMEDLARQLLEVTIPVRRQEIDDLVARLEAALEAQLDRLERIEAKEAELHRLRERIVQLIKRLAERKAQDEDQDGDRGDGDGDVDGGRGDRGDGGTGGGAKGSGEGGDKGAKKTTGGKIRREDLEDTGEDIGGKAKDRYKDVANDAESEDVAEVERLMKLTNRAKLLNIRIPEDATDYYPDAVALFAKKLPTFLQYARLYAGVNIRKKNDMVSYLRYGANWWDGSITREELREQQREVARRRMHVAAAEYIRAMQEVSGWLEGHGTIAGLRAHIADTMFTDAFTDTPKVKLLMSRFVPFYERQVLLNRSQSRPSRASDEIKADAKGIELESLYRVLVKKQLKKYVDDPFQFSDDAVKPKEAKPFKRPLYKFSLEDGPDRTGFPDRRKGRNISTQELAKEFGFRTVEVGKRMPLKERQAHMNWTYDGMHDMIETMGIPDPKIIGLMVTNFQDSTSTRLVVGYGTRGTRASTAFYSHFDSVHAPRIMHFNRRGSDGAVTHEWGHALDHALGLTGLYRALQVRYSSEKAMAYVRKIMSRRASPETYWYVAADGRTVGRIRNSDDPRFYQLTAEDLRISAERAVKDIREGRVPKDIEADSHFLAAAEAIEASGMFKSKSKKKYFSSGVELFARAFEAWFYDEMGDSQSQYMVNEWVGEDFVTAANGYVGRLFPRGSEREDFAVLFRDLMRNVRLGGSGVYLGSTVELLLENFAQHRVGDVVKMLEGLDLQVMAEEMSRHRRSHYNLYWYVQHPRLPAGSTQPEPAPGYSAVGKHKRTASDLPTYFGYRKPLAPDAAAKGRMQPFEMTEKEILERELNVVLLDQEVDDGQGDQAGDAGTDGVGQGGVGPGAGGGDGTGSGPAGGTGGTRGEPEDGTGAGETEVPVPKSEPGGYDWHVGPDYHKGFKRQDMVRLRRSIAALRMMLRMQNGDRNPTPAEQDVLGRFDGIDFMRAVYGKQTDERGILWGEYLRLLEQQIPADALEKIKKTMLYSYQQEMFTTPVEMADVMWQTAQRLGFTGGRVLDGNSQVGRMFATMPEALRSSSTMHLLEKQPLHAGFAKLLFHSAAVTNKSMKDAEVPRNHYDLVITDYSRAVDPSPSSNTGREIQKRQYRDMVRDLRKQARSLRPGGVMVTAVKDGAQSQANLFSLLAREADFVGGMAVPDVWFSRYDKESSRSVAYILAYRRPIKGRKFDHIQDLTARAESATYKSLIPHWNPEKPPVEIEARLRFDDFAQYFTERSHLVGRIQVSSYEAYLMPDEDERRASIEGELAEGELENETLETRVETALATLPKGAYAQPGDAVRRKPVERTGLGAVLPGSITVAPDKGLLMRVMDEDVRILEGKGKVVTAERRVTRELVGLKGLVHEVLLSQVQGASEAKREAARRKLRTAYDKFVKAHGYVSPILGPKPKGRRKKTDPVRAGTFSLWDPDAPTVRLLESLDKKSKTYERGAVQRTDVVDSQQPPNRVDTPEQALEASVKYRGGVDLEWMSSISNLSVDRLKEALVGEIFLDPEGGWETATDYLSGNVRYKLRIARQVARTDPNAVVNVSALEGVLPEPMLPGVNIKATIAANWIDHKTLLDFVEHLLADKWYVRYVRVEPWGHYTVTNAMLARDRRLREFGTNYQMRRYQQTYDLDTIELLNLLRKGMEPIAYDEIDYITETGRRRTKWVKNEDDTASAIAKQATLRDEFAKWAWRDKDRTKRLLDSYDERYNSFVQPVLKGNELAYPEINPVFLAPNKKNAKGGFWSNQVRAQYRALRGSTYVAHQVGTGKTFTGISTAMLARQMGISRKPVIVSQGNKTDELVNEFKWLYPTANVLKIDVPIWQVRDGRVTQKQKFLAAMSLIKLDDTWDAIVMSQQSYDYLRVSKEWQVEQHRAEQTRYHEKHRKYKRLQKEIDRLTRLLTHEQEHVKLPLEYAFENLGIDLVVADEAHRWKNRPIVSYISSKIENVKGKKSQRAIDYDIKSQYLNSTGGRLIPMSGSPFPNSFIELYNLQTQVMPEVMKKIGIYEFDSWIRAFGALGRKIIPKVSGDGYKEVFSTTSFHNLAGLLQVAYQGMDVATAEVEGIETIDLEGGKPQAVVLSQTPAIKELQQLIIDRARRLEAGNPMMVRRANPKPDQSELQEDTTLLLTNDGKRIALDPRLYDAKYPYEPEGKIGTAVKLALDVYHQTNDFKGTQIIFSDMYQSSFNPDFNVYNEIRDRLVEAGIPKKEIAIVRNYSDDKLEGVVDRINSGDIRIALASTEKGGQGLNMQTLGAQIIHLDIDWNAQGLIQRNGRFERSGNLVQKQHGWKLRIVNLAVERTIETFMWEKVEEKVAFINSVMSGKAQDVLELKDLSNVEASAKEIVALASGNPLIKERIELRGRLMQLRALHRSWRQNRAQTRKELGVLPAKIQYAAQRVKELEDHLKRIANIESVALVRLDPDNRGRVLERKKLEIGHKDLKKEWTAAVKHHVNLARASKDVRGMMIGGLLSPNGNIDIVLGFQAPRNVSVFSTGEAKVLNSDPKSMKVYTGELWIPEIEDARVILKSSAFSSESLASAPLRRSIATMKKRVAKAKDREAVNHEGLVKDETNLKSDLEKKFEHAKEMEESTARLEKIEQELAADPDEPVARVWFGDPELTDATVDDLSPDVLTRIEGVVNRILPQGTPVRVVDKPFGKARYLGGWSQKLGMVQLSARARDPERVLHHEAIHVLRTRFTPNEWRVMVETAEAEGWIERYRIDERYPTLFDADGNPTFLAWEEAVAHGFEHWYARRTTSGITGVVLRVFAKIRRVLLALKAAFRPGGELHGVSLDETFQSVMEGEVAQRSENTFLQGLKDERASARVETDQERIAELQKGVTRRNRMIDELKQFADWAVKSFTREYIDLPNDPRYAKARDALRHLKAAPALANEIVSRHLRSITEGLSEDQMDLLTKKVFYDDFHQDFRLGLTEIPVFGADRKRFMKEFRRVNELLARPENKDVMDRVRRRHAKQRELHRDLVKAGILDRDTLRRKNYITHQVIEYAEETVRAPTGQGLRKPKWARRMGTSLDINMNYVEAEAAWMLRSVRDLRVKEALDRIERAYDERPEALTAIRKENLRLVDVALKSEATRAMKSGKANWEASEIENLTFKKMVGVWKGLLSPGHRSDFEAAHPHFTVLNEYRMRLGKNFGVLSDWIEKNPEAWESAPKGEIRDGLLSLAGYVHQYDMVEPWPALTWLAIPREDIPTNIRQEAASAFKNIAGRREHYKTMVPFIGHNNMDTALKRLRRAGYSEWDGRDTFQADEGNLLFTAWTVPERIVNKLHTQVENLARSADPKGEFLSGEVLREVQDSLRQQVVMAGPKKQMVLPSELAATLKGFRDREFDRDIGWIEQFMTRVWKKWRLLNPAGAPKYWLRNLGGDFDHVLATMGIKGVREQHIMDGIRELWDMQIKRGKPSDEYMEAIQTGVLDSGWTAAEVVDHQAEIEDLLNAGNVRKLWHAILKFNTFRENILRWTTYKWVRARLKTLALDKDLRPTPENAKLVFLKIGLGGIRREELFHLGDWGFMAAQYSRDTLGDYLATTHTGQLMSRFLQPFWRWKEVNWKFYARFGSNISFAIREEGKVSPEIAQAMTRAGLMIGKKAAVMMVFNAALWMLLHYVWNNVLHGDEEEELSDNDRRRLHLILGKIGDTIVMLDTPGALSDFLEWAGFEDVRAALEHVARGRGDIQDVLREFVQAPANVWAQGLTPLIKVPVELLTGQQWFPDVFNRRAIKSNWYHALQATAMDRYVDFAGALTGVGRPTRGAGVALAQSLVSLRHADSMAYNKIRGQAYQFKRHVSDRAYWPGMTRKMRLYHYYRMALRFENPAKATALLKQLREEGVTGKDRAAMVQRQHPLGMFTKRERAAFMRTLNPEERRNLRRAVQYWREVYLGAKTKTQ